MLIFVLCFFVLTVFAMGFAFLLFKLVLGWDYETIAKVYAGLAVVTSLRLLGDSIDHASSARFYGHLTIVVANLLASLIFWYLAKRQELEASH